MSPWRNLPSVPLGEAFPYLILDARYERVREAGVISNQAVLIAIGIDWDGRRQVLAVELANRESRSSWRDFLIALKARGLNGVEFVVADDHAGLRAALREVLPEAAYQRCYVHYADVGIMCTSCATRSTMCTPGRRRLPARAALAVRSPRPQRGAPRSRRLAGQVVGQVSPAHRLGRRKDRRDADFLPVAAQHHKHLKSINMLERLNEEIKRRIHVVRIFPNADSCLRLVRALAVETHENWLEQHRYLNMDDLHEHKKEALRQVA
jgi:transposase-like protein